MVLREIPTDCNQGAETGKDACLTLQTIATLAGPQKLLAFASGAQTAYRRRTRIKPAALSARITPYGFHAPPVKPGGLWQMVCGCPTEASALLSFPPLLNATRTGRIVVPRILRCYACPPMACSHYLRCLAGRRRCSANGGGCLRLSGCHWYPSRRRRRQPPDGVHHQSLCCGRSNHPLSGSAGMEFALVVEMPPCRFHAAHEFVAIKRLRQYVPRP
jgi:hypothetical protein